MKKTSLLLAYLFMAGCNMAPEPPEQRIFDTWEVSARDTLAADEQLKGLERTQYNHLLRLLESGLAQHRYEFRRSGELAFGRKLLKPIAHFQIKKQQQGRITLELRDVGHGVKRTEDALAWFVGGQLHLKRGSQTLVLSPD